MSQRRHHPGYGDLLQRADQLLERSAELLDTALATPKAKRSVPLSVQRASANRKMAPQREERARSGRRRFVPIGPFCVTTYVSISATCPTSCPYKDNGCYAQAGASHLTMNGLDRAAAGWKPLEVTQAEARAIDGLWKRGKAPQDGARGGRDLRLHVAGDASCATGARELGRSVDRFRSRGGGLAWTYTHRWREIPRDAWGPISVLASCETPSDVDEALDLGYAPALTVESFDSPRAFPAGGAKIVPCPAEAGKTTCVECRLCIRGGLAKRGRGIGFLLHGGLVDKARARLRVLQ